MSIDCPKWIQHQIFRNLKKEARDKINPAGDKQAEKLLQVIKKKVAKAEPKLAAGRATVKADKSEHNRVAWLLRVPVARGRYAKFLAGGCSNVLMAVLRQKSPMKRHKLGVGY